MKATILILAILSSSQSMYGQPFIYGVNGYEGLVRVNTANGDRTVLLAESPAGLWLTSIAVSPSTSELIVGAGATIFRSDMEVTRRDTILTSDSFFALQASSGGTPCEHSALAVDESENKIYAMGDGWCGSHFISMNLDGSDLKWIGDVHEGGTDLAIHPETRRVYFSQWAGVKSYIISKELDGSDPDTLITEKDLSGRGIGGAVFDFEGGSMYWQKEGRIKRANLDGSGEHVLIELQTTNARLMHLDPVNGYLYLSEPDSSGPLWRVNLDGSEKTSVSQGGFWDMVIVASTTTSAIPHEEVPDITSLLHNYPNPFNPLTMIEYELAATQRVTIKVRDALGRLVAILVDEVQPAGSHSVNWIADSDTPSGTYFYTLETSEGVVTRSMVLVK